MEISSIALGGHHSQCEVVEIEIHSDEPPSADSSVRREIFESIHLDESEMEVSLRG